MSRPVAWDPDGNGTARMPTKVACFLDTNILLYAALGKVDDPDKVAVRAGIELSQRFKISFWDAAIIFAAERLGAPVLYTEDLNHGQFYGDVRVVNPFRPE